MPSSSGIPESSIVFFSGGHDHDGVSSGLIKTNQYSIYDWEIGVTVGNGQRGQKQSENAAGFRLLIDSIVKETTLGPAGIRLSPNTITGLHIASNTITANELSANIVLVNNVIRSNNFNGGIAANGTITSGGTVGWAISGDGTAVLDIAYIRGSIQADSLYINALNYWFSNGIFSVGTGNDSLVYDGTNLSLSGEITATTGEIAGFTIGPGDVLTTGGNFLGDMTIGEIEDGVRVGMEINGPNGLSTRVQYDYISVESSNGDNVTLENNGNIISTGTLTVVDIDVSNNVIIDGGLGVANNVEILGDLDVGNNLTVIGSISGSSISTAGNVTMDNGINNGAGIQYHGLSVGPGSANNMGFLWDNPDIIGAVDNTVSCVLGTVSDVRFKTNITNIGDECIDKIINVINVIQYTPVDKLNNDKIGSTRRSGVVAQEVINVFPDLVSGNDDENPDAYLSVNYAGFVPYLIKTIQHLNDRIKKLEE